LLVSCALTAGCASLAHSQFPSGPAPEKTAPKATSPTAQGAASQVRAALEQLDAWLGNNPNADAWRQYLQTAELRNQLEKGGDADPAAVSQVLQQFSSSASGLELPRFAAMRAALKAWLAELRASYADDVTKLVSSYRSEFSPVTPQEFAGIRADMRSKASALLQFLGGASSPLARGWKTYLKWDQLEPHFADDFQITMRSLNQLDEVLLRLHSNQPGLELPPFVSLAKAVVRYRSLALWAAASAKHDALSNYQRLLTNIATELKRHLERPTTETSWKIGRILGLVDALDTSREFVAAIRRRFAQPNIQGYIAATVIQRMPNRPVNQVRPVRDCILGTSIFGTACTLGDVQYQLVPSPRSVQLAINLTGHAHSQTNGYHQPVRISSTGLTNFRAYKLITFNDEGFLAGPASVFATTNTHINSVRKTGGNFGRKLVEKIAWRRTLEQKPQAEAISSRHTEGRVSNEFNDFVSRDLGDLRRRYEEKIRNPLIRRAMSPEYLLMSSQPDGVKIETTFAGRNQIAAHGPPPKPQPGADLVLQIHESAVNNYLPLALASAKISQQSVEHPPQLEGDIPNWIKVMSIARPKLAAAAATGAKIVEKAHEVIDQTVEGQTDERPPAERKAPPFRPYSITLNADAPVSVRFDDGKLVIRIRAAQLASEDSEYANWDFIVTYQLTTQSDRIVLRRAGDIEVFPTGFDPAWDKQLTAQQSAFRSTLAKNMNARARSGESFPHEIPIEPIRVTRLGTLLLQELTADDGWLTVSWILPPQTPPRTTLPPATIPPHAG
jgi:hypothetical protein